MNIGEVQQRWPDHEAALRHLERVRWAGQPICPYCGSSRAGSHASKDKTTPRWQCHACHRAFSATVGTVFHQTHLPLNKWFLAVAVVLDDQSISSAEIGRILGVPYKTAWSVARRLREAAAADEAQASLFRRIISADNKAMRGEDDAERAFPRSGRRAAGGAYR